MKNRSIASPALPLRQQAGLLLFAGGCLALASDLARWLAVAG
ncbi:hypothetical protein [Eleftheria terrae]|nr:hypothetical protein [Eleftheria terrae]WKB51529.1 hypothetical protein N7L95_17200 [Eleftheria terrae]